MLKRRICGKKRITGSLGHEDQREWNIKHSAFRDWTQQDIYFRINEGYDWLINHDLYTTLDDILGEGSFYAQLLWFFTCKGQGAIGNSKPQIIHQFTPKLPGLLRLYQNVKTKSEESRKIRVLAYFKFPLTQRLIQNDYDRSGKASIWAMQCRVFMKTYNPRLPEYLPTSIWFAGAYHATCYDVYVPVKPIISLWQYHWSDPCAFLLGFKKRNQCCWQVRNCGECYPLGGTGKLHNLL